MLTIESRRVENVDILTLAGQLTYGEEVIQFRNEIRKLDPGAKIIVNLSEVTYVDSSGLGELVSVHVSTRRHGGNIVLSQITEKSKDVFLMTKLLTIFVIAQDDEGALKKINDTTPT